MTISITICALAGIAIGFRFKIYMMVPAILVAALSTVAISMAQAEQYWSIASAIAVNAIALQIGFLCGSFACAMKEMPVAETIKVATSPADAYRSRSGISA